jgi:hypothetical protein
MHCKYIQTNELPKSHDLPEPRSNLIYQGSLLAAQPRSDLKKQRGITMVMIPVFDGASKADPEKFLRQFKRACIANGDRHEQAWLEMLPIYLDDEASW